MDGDSFQVLALDQGRPVASSVGFVADGDLWWAGVFVRPTCRGDGLLGRMLDAVSGWGREQGCMSVVLEVHGDNSPAVPAYEKLGFIDTGERRPCPLDPGGCELLMRRPL